MTPGMKTSEFWMALFGTIATSLLTVHSQGPLTLGTFGWNVLPSIAYILSRGVAKSGDTISK